jgi:hypothetical protein
MERDIAIRLDGMVIGANGNLDGIAHYMKNNLSPQEYSERSIFIGKAMGALYELSTSLHAIFPDIVPKELQPPVK